MNIQKIITIIIIIVVFISCSAELSIKDHTPKRVAILGDSLVSSGNIASMLNLWTTDKIEFMELGDGGATPESLYFKLNDFIQHKYDEYIIMVGINSIDQPASTMKYLSACARYIKSRSINTPKIYMCTLLPWRGYETWTVSNQNNSDQINEWIKTKPDGIDGVLIFDWMKGVHMGMQSDEFRGDGLHPNEQGYIAMAGYIFRLLYDGVYNKK